MSCRLTTLHVTVVTVICCIVLLFLVHLFDTFQSCPGRDIFCFVSPLLFFYSVMLTRCCFGCSVVQSVDTDLTSEKHGPFGWSCMVFVDLEKAYDRVPRELIWYSLRRKSVPEAYINNIRDMYAGWKTSVMTSSGKTKEIAIEVELHQGSDLSPLFFVIIMYLITY